MVSLCQPSLFSIFERGISYQNKVIFGKDIENILFVPRVRTSELVFSHYNSLWQIIINNSSKLKE
jgi:hypothetical protein